MFSLKVLKLFYSMKGTATSFDNALNLYLDSNDLTDDEFRQLTILLAFACANHSSVFSGLTKIIESLEANK